MIVAPNSPSPRANASAAPAPSPPRESGKHHAHEDSPRPCAERSGGGRQRRIDGLEGGDRGAEVERARDERHREHHGSLRECDVDSERVDLVAEQSEAAERNEETDTGDRRRQDERKLDECDQDVAEGSAPRRDPVRGRCSEEEDRRHRDRDRLGRHANRLACRVASERRDQLARRHLQEDRHHGQDQEGEDGARRHDERRPKDPVYGCAPGIGRKP